MEWIICGIVIKMELTEENVLKVLEELIPYIEADGGYLQLYDI